MTPEQMICTVLRTPTCRSINFVLGGITVDGPNFEVVAMCIESGDITVDVQPGKGDVAHYLSDSDVFEIGFATLPSVLHAGLLVHESVHAIADFQEVDIKVRVSEAAGYVAQALMFYYVKKSEADANPGVNPFADPILSAAWDASKPLRNKTGGTLTTAQLSALDAAIIANPHYTGKENKKVLCNGLF
ncbi:hypothetical protein [Vannielia litorea]|uniref:hypothetical protein n=1 Tax=Vannielia litorea TaxID=1217970 RepID=UPI001BCD0C70|nr:hypothetical protein [Vannielia litorea]MBS8226137.1 hypothetical protein [Vannielia litorea]